MQLSMVNKQGPYPKTRKVRVAIVGSPDLEFYGGTQVTVIHLSGLLQRSGYDVTVLGSGTFFDRAADLERETSLWQMTAPRHSRMLVVLQNKVHLSLHIPG